MKDMNPIFRNLLVTVGVAAAVVVLGVAAKYGGQLVDYIMKNGTKTLLVVAVVTLVSALVFGAIEMIVSNKKHNVNDDWPRPAQSSEQKGGPNGKSESWTVWSFSFGK